MPLYHPCRCSGSIKYVHQECLEEWLRFSGKGNHCEVCHQEYAFKKIYREGTPQRMTPAMVLRGALEMIVPAPLRLLADALMTVLYISASGFIARLMDCVSVEELRGLALLAHGDDALDVLASSLGDGIGAILFVMFVSFCYRVLYGADDADARDIGGNGRARAAGVDDDAEGAVAADEEDGAAGAQRVGGRALLRDLARLARMLCDIVIVLFAGKWLPLFVGSQLLKAVRDQSLLRSVAPRLSARVAAALGRSSALRALSEIGSAAAAADLAQASPAGFADESSAEDSFHSYHAPWESASPLPSDGADGSRGVPLERLAVFFAGGGAILLVALCLAVARQVVRVLGDRERQAQLLGNVRDGLRRVVGLAKGGIVLLLEGLVLPELLGWLLDAATLAPVGGTPEDRLVLLAEAPLLCFLLHWAVGFVCLLLFSALLQEARLCLAAPAREAYGNLLGEPEPEWQDQALGLWDWIDREPMVALVRRFTVAACVHCLLLAFGVALPVALGHRLLPRGLGGGGGPLALRFETTFADVQLPFELLMFHVVLPLLTERLAARSALRGFVKGLLRCSAMMLGVERDVLGAPVALHAAPPAAANGRGAPGVAPPQPQQQQQRQEQVQQQEVQQQQLQLQQQQLQQQQQPAAGGDNVILAVRQPLPGLLALSSTLLLSVFLGGTLIVHVPIALGRNLLPLVGINGGNDIYNAVAGLLACWLIAAAMKQLLDAAAAEWRTRRTRLEPMQAPPAAAEQPCEEDAAPPPQPAAGASQHTVREEKEEEDDEEEMVEEEEAAQAQAQAQAHAQLADAARAGGGALAEAPADDGRTPSPRKKKLFSSAARLIRRLSSPLKRSPGARAGGYFASPPGGKEAASADEAPEGNGALRVAAPEGERPGDRREDPEEAKRPDDSAAAARLGGGRRAAAGWRRRCRCRRCRRGGAGSGGRRRGGAGRRCASVLGGARGDGREGDGVLGGAARPVARRPAAPSGPRA